MEYEPLLLDLLSPAVVYPAAAGVAGLAIGLTLAAVRGRRRRNAAVSDASPEAADDVRDLRRTVYLLQNENRNLSHFLMTMPDLARRLNEQVERKEIPALLISSIDRLFEAEQVLVFLTTTDRRHLVLAGAKGLPESITQPAVVPFGQGRLGWVAEHKTVMDENDFHQKPKHDTTAKIAFNSEIQPVFRTELCAPMIADDETLGVISLGGLLRRPKNEKSMIKMVADLGTIALQNTLLRRRLEDSANSDGLTGLANKRHFLKCLGEEVHRAASEAQNLSLFIFDIDHFKKYNDTNGHLAGDEALRLTGRIIKDVSRPDDLCARYGGEEFVILMPGTDKTSAMAVAEQLRLRIEATPYPSEEHQPLGKVTISGGVATFPFDAQESGDLIRRADKALYQGKHGGRNRVVAAPPGWLSDDHSSSIDLPAAGRQTL